LDCQGTAATRKGRAHVVVEAERRRRSRRFRGSPRPARKSKESRAARQKVAAAAGIPLNFQPPATSHPVLPATARWWPDHSATRRLEETRQKAHCVPRAALHLLTQPEQVRPQRLDPVPNPNQSLTRTRKTNRRGFDKQPCGRVYLWVQALSIRSSP